MFLLRLLIFRAQRDKVTKTLHYLNLNSISKDILRKPPRIHTENRQKDVRIISNNEK